MPSSARVACFIVLVFATVAPVHAQPRIERLEASDPLFRQHQQLLSEFHVAYARGEPVPPLQILSYTVKPGEELVSIAARLNLPYSAIATLNRLSNATQLQPEDQILIPSRPGLFAVANASSELERLVGDRLAGSPESEPVILPGSPVDSPTGSVTTLPGSDFTGAERALFFRVVFTHPTPGHAISSRFGYRFHPFDGRRRFHAGVDFSAPFGTPVAAAAPGVVTDISRDRWLGLMVTVDHSNGYQTRYAHLQEVIVESGQTLAVDDTIGYVGSTGLSTGPHLHFEIRREGTAVDPVPYLD